MARDSGKSGDGDTYFSLVLPGLIPDDLTWVTESSVDDLRMTRAWRQMCASSKS